MRYSQELYRTPVKDVVSFCEGISTIKDIISLADNTKGLLNSIKNDNKMYAGSIAKRSAQLVLVFPVLVSSSINIKTAMLISKAIERKCVSMLQLLFSAINLTSYKDTKTVYDYIAKFHKNIDMPANTWSLEDFIKLINTLNEKSKNESTNFVIDQEAYDKVMESFKNIFNEAKINLNKHSINDYSIRRSIYNENYDIRLINEEDTDNNENSSSPDTTNTFKIQKQDYSKQVIDSDINKANQLVPTLMNINFTTIDDNLSVPVQRTAIIGVKAKFYPVDGIELRGRLSRKFNENNGLLNLLRASTGEISFWKDIAFAFDKIKNDAINIAHGSTNSKLFQLLQNRAAANKSFWGKGNNNPITTLVVNQEEVEMLKRDSGMNLSNPKIAKIVFDDFNLMGLVIVDDATETAKFLFDDNSNAFEVVSYTSLERESKDNSTMNKMVNLLQKAGRI